MFSDVETSDERTRIRKTSKPLMEKKRRARINRCLAELKQILISDHHVSIGHSKWEKADILEMTVEYVRKLRMRKGSTDEDSNCQAVNEVSDKASPSNSNNSDGSEKIPWSRYSKKRRSSPPPPVCTASTSSSPKRFRSVDCSQNSPQPAVFPCAQPFLPTPITPSNMHHLMAQHLFAMQHYQSMKLAAMAPVSQMSLSSPISTPPIWRPI
ncbi:hypothetical protein WR25_10046 [Diploscapter pachys]|uniref:BHLH domain-containing protein n=1 Tax=Diploscapter pachys TaxID=2018661 RepID=A0A2A2JAL2_9BILA|nr:hypothetical protein WR25_10046 [Diploscapter pachys]